MWKKAMAIGLGSLLLAIGINVFLVPHRLLDGGMIGIGLIAKYLWNIKAGMTIICLSVPLYVIAWFYYRTFFYNSLHGLLVSSFMIDVCSIFRGIIVFPPTISSIIGGIFVGTGIGMMLREETSTGGTDLLAQFIGKMTGWNVGIIIFIIDMLVITVGSVIVPVASFMNSFIVVCVVGIVTTMLTRTKR
ncbi:YitT family protein [Anoxybacteroides tepidamans]|uniref:YitT family protein n=1 Tax=Anoxybacteroides tepidamans TaxID=265948 RepID=UPI0004808E77|nr:YitT family protein [Anoxybacillus tepidamans]